MARNIIQVSVITPAMKELQNKAFSRKKFPEFLARQNHKRNSQGCDHVAVTGWQPGLGTAKAELSKLFLTPGDWLEALWYRATMAV